jgi:hypothetical protein
VQDLGPLPLILRPSYYHPDCGGVAASRSRPSYAAPSCLAQGQHDLDTVTSPARAIPTAIPDTGNHANIERSSTAIHRMVDAVYGVWNALRMRPGGGRRNLDQLIFGSGLLQFIASSSLIICSCHIRTPLRILLSLKPNPCQAIGRVTAGRTNSINWTLHTPLTTDSRQRSSILLTK